jgi:outer membrane protein TolC
MNRTFLVTSLWAAVAAALSAQTPAAGSAGQPTSQNPGGSTAARPALSLTVDDAVKMAIDHNIDLSVERIDPQISDAQVASAAGVYRPTFNTSVDRDNQLQPPSSFLIPTPTRNDAITSSVGVAQKLPRFGTSYSVSWQSVHTNSNSFLNSFNPLVQSGLALNVSQPLIRDLSIDSARQQLATSRVDRDVAETRLNEAVVQTTASVKSTYWNLASAIANVEARQSALELAQELVRTNKAKVDIGQSPPLDLVSAQAEVAANQEQLIIAETAVKDVEDQLRALIFDTSDPAAWKIVITPADAPPLGQVSPDLDQAVTNALHDRSDLVRARKDIEHAQVNVAFTANQRLPDVRLNAGYLANGLGGTQVLRTDGFPGTIVGPGASTDYGSVLNQLFTNKYPTWKLGVSVSYPIGQGTEDANYARAKLEHQQSRERLKSAESRAVQQVRDAWRKIEMNARRIETARAARQLADQRLDSERKRFDVGMSTSFLVIQAQRDLVQARTNEVAAILAYALALVDFDTVQLAPLAQPQTPPPATTTAPTTTTPGQQ